MSVSISPPMFLQFLIPGTNAPAIGYKLFTYVAGTSTKQPTWTDYTQLVQNSNPIIFDSNGVCSVWLDPTLTYKFVWTTPNDTDPPNSPIRTQDGIEGSLTLVSLTQNIVGFSLYPPSEFEGTSVVAPWYYYGNVARYGADRTDVADSTSAFQAALDQQRAGGPAGYFQNGAYKLTQTLNLYAGSKLTGDGWASNAGTFAPQTGSGINWMGSPGVPILSGAGVSTGNYVEGIVLRDFAIYVNGTDVGGAGIKLLFAAFFEITNIYIAGLTGSGGSNGCGAWIGESSYKGRITGLFVEDCSTSIYLPDAGEDITITASLGRSFLLGTNSVGIHLKNQAQCVTLDNCDFSDNDIPIKMEQGQDGTTGLPLPMQCVAINSQFENYTQAAALITSSNQNAASHYYPSLLMESCRYFIDPSQTTPNNGQALVYAQCLSSVKIVQPAVEGGISYGALIAMSGFGQTFSGSAQPGQVVFDCDDPTTYSTARLHPNGNNTTARAIPGDNALARFTSTAFAPSSASSIPFSVIVGDPWNWYNSANVAIQPKTKGRTVQFWAQVATASAPTGQHLLQLFKNGSALITLDSDLVATAGHVLVLKGTTPDVPNSTDLYTVVYTPPSSVTVDITNSYFWAETAGT